MSSFSVATLQEKMSRLSASQESIETLSLWIIHHKAFAKTSVAVWATSFISGEFSHTKTHVERASERDKCSALVASVASLERFGTCF